MDVEWVESLRALGIAACTTTRHSGNFAWHAAAPSAEVLQRWERLQAFTAAPRLVSAHQVHAARILHHTPTWEGLLRCGEADGHFASGGVTAMAVSLADCVPVFLGEPSGRAAIVHSGWKGTAAGIAGAAVDLLVADGCRAADIVAHCGPAICGGCYEVGPEVYRQVTGTAVAGPTRLDLRSAIAASLRARGLVKVSVSPWCTRCHNDRFFSHRAGDVGRQLGVIVACATDAEGRRGPRSGFP